MFDIFELVIKSIFFISDCFLPKLRLESKYKFQQCKNNIVITFV